MYILEGFRLKCVFASMIAFSHFSLNVVPWYTTVSKKIVSVSDISAGEFHIRVMCKFIGSVNLKKSTMSGLLLSHREKCHLCGVFKRLVWRRSCLNFGFQCMRP